jgi:hypothetical protein
MQGLGIANQAAQNLGALGQTQFGQNMGITGLQNQFGLQQQQQAQNLANTKYEDFQNAQNYPYKQMGFMSDMIRGLPTSQTGATMYQSAPTAIQNLTSLGLGAAGISSLMKAEGGTVRSYANGGAVAFDGGGSVFSPEFKRYAVDHIDPRQLPMAQQNAQARGDLETNQFAMQEMADDAALRRGIAPALPAGVDVVRRAGGGILAFSEPTEENNNSLTNSGGGGGYNLDAKNPFVQMMMQNAENIRGAEYKGVTPEEYNKAIEARHKLLSGLFGTNEAATTQAARLKEDDEARAGTLNQNKGTALLEAASAVLQPGGTMRGLGAAGAAFGRSYGQALQLDKAEKRAINRQQFDLADSIRKEKMGILNDSIKAADQLGPAKREEFKSQIEKYKALANIGSAGARAMGKNGAGSSKIAPQTEAYQTYYKYFKDLYPEETDNSIGKRAMDKALEMKAPGLPGVTARTEATADEKARERTAKRLLVDTDYNEAQRKKDTTGMTARRAAILAEEQKGTPPPYEIPQSPPAKSGAPKGGAPKAAAGATTPDTFNKQWATLKQGQTLVGPDGVTYTKR